MKKFFIIGLLTAIIAVLCAVFFIAALLTVGTELGNNMLFAALFCLILDMFLMFCLA